MKSWQNNPAPGLGGSQIEKGKDMKRLIVLFLLFPMLASCGGWTSKCTKRSSCSLSEEKIVSVGSEMVQIGCFGIRYEPYGPSQSLFNRVAYDEQAYTPIVESELIYSGRSGDTLFVAYREYSVRAGANGYLTGGYARPAFYQHIQYDLRTSNTIVFQNWIIQVLEADNQQIRFIVTKEPLPAW